VTLLPDFGEQVRVGLLSGFIEQRGVVFVRLKENNTPTGFWWAGTGWTLARFWWAGKGCCCESQSRQRSYRVLVSR